MLPAFKHVALLLVFLAIISNQKPVSRRKSRSSLCFFFSGMKREPFVKFKENVRIPLLLLYMLRLSFVSFNLGKKSVFWRGKKPWIPAGGICCSVLRVRIQLKGRYQTSSPSCIEKEFRRLCCSTAWRIRAMRGLMLSHLRPSSFVQCLRRLIPVSNCSRETSLSSLPRTDLGKSLQR